METAEPTGGSYEAGGEQRFTGEAWLSPSRSVPDGTALVVVHFAPGARTHWHRHPGGQLLYVLAGRGRIRSRNGEGQTLLPGHITATPPDAWHWHGAEPGAPMVHVAVNVGGPLEWGDPVVDAEYAEGF